MQPPKPGGPEDKDACNMAMLAHLLGALMGFLGPLIIWLMKKDESEFVDDQGKEALNFQLTMLILHIVASALTCGLGALITYPLGLIFGIIGAMKAKDGERYRYPFNFRMIS